MQSLNHIYRTIWSDALGAWIAVSETTKIKGKRSASSVIRSVQISTASTNTTGIKNRLKPLLIALACSFALNAYGNPIGGTVTSGQATFATHGNTLTVTNTPGTIINWQGFSINTNEVTNFAQQSATSSVLNRVTSANPSNILGSLQSNGRVFLVNPNGIVFGAGSTVNVGGLVASTLNLSDADFKAGRNNFTGGTAATGNVSNAGNINAANGGQIYLIAPNVENTGIITAPNGEIFLAAGNSVTLVNSQDPNLAVNITAPAGNATNVGQLVASAGSLGLFGAMVSNTGTVSADSATLQGGKIVFKASQSAAVGGTVSATGTTGGSIEVQGNDVHITSSALLDASGANGGGAVLVGGGAHGADTTVMNAQTTTVDAGSIIKADATQNGNGGNITVWSDVATQAHGSISAQGGANGGNGGFIETSGQSLDVNGILVNTTAPHGLTGTWLLDPQDFTIASTGGDITGTQLSSELGGTNITILSSSGATAGLGNINVNDVVSWSANTLTLTAANNININSPMNLVGSASLWMNPTGTVLVGMNGGGFIGQVNFASSGSLWIGAAQNGTYLYTVINSIASLQAINTNSTTLGGNYALGSNLDDASAAFTSIGTFALSFTGTFDGLGHTISNLAISLPATTYVGLFGYISSSATVRNTGLIGGTITGLNDVGGLVGYNNGGHVTNSYDTGSVNGNNYVGGLVGESFGGSVTNSFATGNVTGTTNYVGGLVGRSDSTTSVISNSYATGSVNGSTYVGGLVGENNASCTVTNSYATGNVVALSGVGGLAGENLGTVSYSYAQGNVTSSGMNNYVGGLVGYNNSGTIISSYATGTVAGAQVTYIGGLAGESSGSISNSYSTGSVSSTYGSVGSLVGLNGGSITNVYALGTVNSNPVSAGNIIGTQSGSITNVVVGFPALTTDNWTGASGDSLVTTAGNWSAGVPTIFSNVIFSNTNYGAHNVVSIPSNVMVGGIDTSAATNLVTNFTGANVSSLTIGSTAAITFISTVNYGTSGKINLPAAPTFTYNGTAYTVINSWTSLLADVNTTGSNYVLGSNINGGTIGTNTTFNGIFDGLGHAITGLTVSGTVNDLGLFGTVSLTNSAISNLGLINETVIGNYEVGGLVGLNHGTINNCYVNALSLTAYGTIYTGQAEFVGALVGYNYGAVSHSSATGTLTNGYYSYYVGGLIGSNASTGSLSSSYSAVNLNLGTYQTYYAGGLVGTNSGSINASYATGNVTESLVGYLNNDVGGLVGANYASIGNSFALGSVTGSGTNTFVGGLAGTNTSTSTITSSYAMGSVTGSSYVGGLVGNNSGTISNSYATGGVTGTTQIGGLVGNNSSAGSLSNSFYDAQSVQINGYTFSPAGGAQSGKLTPGAIFDTQYQSWIANGESLNLANYASTLPAGTGGYYNVSTVQGLQDMLGFVENSGSLFRLTANINLTSYPGLYIPTYAGTFDGNGFTISNAVVSVPSNSNIGLFGQLFSTGSVTNLTVASPIISGAASVGGIVGYNSGTITNSTVTSETIASTGSNVGGLAGSSYGTISGDHVSGGTVAGGGKVGGLVGASYGTTSGSNSVSNVTVDDSGADTGGLFGYISNGTFTGGSVSGGSVTGTADVGGLVGYMSGGTISGTSITGVAVLGTGSVGGFAGYNSATISSGSVNGGSVTSTGAYAGGLVGSNHGNITNSSVTNVAVTSTANDVGGLVGYNYGAITGSTVSGGTVRGVANVGGLAGYSYGKYTTASSISNSSVTNVAVIGTGNFIGGLVGLNYGNSDSASITGSFVSGGSVTGSSSSYVGGLVGQNKIYQTASFSTISGTSYTTGVAIAGLHYVGGLVGSNYGTVTNTKVSGGSVAGSSYVGGLAGYNNGSITGSYATANVTGNSGSSFVGGLVGSNNSSISNSYATGNVSSDSLSSYVGGLVGINNHTVATSYATGSVSGGSYVGGLVGKNSGQYFASSISDSYATGSVNGVSNVGGLVGYNFGGSYLPTITNSFSTGVVTGTSSVGGLVGNNTGTVSGSYWDTITSGQPTTGIGGGTIAGATGLSTTAMMASGTNPITAGGWNTGTWGIVSGSSYPYLLWSFGSVPQIISGTLSGAGNGDVSIQTVENGTLLGTVFTNSTGYFYELLAAGTIPNGDTLLALVGGTNPTAATVRLSDGNNLSGVNLTPGMLIISSNSSASISNTNLVAAEGSLGNMPYTASGNNITTTLALQTVAGTNYNLNGNITSAGSQTWNGPVAISTGGAYSLIATGASSDVTVKGGINYTGTSTAGSLTIEAGRNISVSNAPIQSTGTQALNVTLDSAYSGTGSVGIFSGGDILSNGGDITIGGGTGTISAGVGFAQGYYGVFYDGSASGNGVDIRANLSAAGGNIIINGIADISGYAFNPIGVSIGGVVSTTGSGTITLTGQSLSPTNSPYGVEIGNAGTGETTVNGSVTSVNGNILVNATSGSTNSHGNIGLLIVNNSTVQTTGSGNITLNGTAASTAPTTGGGGIDIQSYSGNPSVLANSGNIAMNSSNGSGMSLSNTTITSTSGTVTLDSVGGTINQSAGSISGGLLTTTSAGGTTLTGANTVASFKANNTVSGDIALTNTYAPFTIDLISNSGGNVKIDNTGAIVVAGPSNTPGNFALTAHSPITITSSGSINAGGAVSLIAGSAGSTAPGDTITINGTIAGSSVSLAAHKVSGNIPAGAIITIDTATNAPAPTVLNTLASVVDMLLPSAINFPVEGLATTSIDNLQASSLDEKKEEAANLAANKINTNNSATPTVKSLPVCN